MLKPLTIYRLKSLEERTYKAIGHLKIGDIGTIQIQRFINNLAEDGINKQTGGGLSTKTQKLYLGFISDVFNYAMARQGYPTNIMVHSDQGSQYCSRDFRSLLLTNNCIQSMSRRGNCWDNAVTESFFHTLKGHVVHGSVFTTRKEANAVLFEYIEIYYNRIRRHSANGWLSPEAFEKKYFKNLEGFVVHDTV
jgi:hypothetical protein